jgi:hypothetical protein
MLVLLTAAPAAANELISVKQATHDVRRALSAKWAMAPKDVKITIGKKVAHSVFAGEWHEWKATGPNGYHMLGDIDMLKSNHLAPDEAPRVRFVLSPGGHP